MSGSRLTVLAARQATVSPPPAGEELATRLRFSVTGLNCELRQRGLSGGSPAQASAEKVLADVLDGLFEHFVADG
jgi:hypothetical protein